MSEWIVFGPCSYAEEEAQLRCSVFRVPFTCLTVRVIHIEVAHSLDTNSFINALGRFISRRGWPQRIQSHNGSNFISGEKELQEAINA